MDVNFKSVSVFVKGVAVAKAAIAAADWCWKYTCNKFIWYAQLGKGLRSVNVFLLNAVGLSEYLESVHT